MDNQQLGYKREPNVGGLAKLWLIAADQVLGVLDPYLFEGESFTIPAYGLPIADNAVISEIQFPAGAATFEESEIKGEEGKSYPLTISAIIPKHESELLDYLHRNEARRWIAIFTDRNGLTYLSGSPEQGLDLFLSRAIGSTNSVKLSLEGRSWHPCFMLEDCDLETLLPYSTTVYQNDPTLYN